MAFTTGEFLRGAISAWLWFVAVSAIVQLVMVGPFAIVVFLYTGPWSVLTLVVAAPLAYAIGRLLRHVARMGVHMVAFAGFGVVVGAGAIALAVATGFIPASQVFGAAPLTIANICSAGIAVWIGWSWAAFGALRRDRAAREALAPGMA